jgi:RHS repeat-associated protein
MRSPFLQGTFCFLLFASPLATTATEPITGSTLVNPNPAPCCACLTWVDSADENANEIGPQTPPTVLNLEKGAGTATVFLKYKEESDCTTALTVTFWATPAESNQAITHPNTYTTTLEAGQNSGPVEFEFTADQLRISPSWEIHFKCDTIPASTTSSESGSEIEQCPPPHKVTLNGGCTSCMTCEYSGDSSINPDGSIDIPTTISGGDTSGELRYTPGGLGGSGQLSNRGPSALTANTPPGFAVAKTDNQITAVTTGNTQIEVLPADATILAYDPNAFVITHTVVGATAPFRRTTISLVDVGGIKILRTDSEFDGTVTRHEQSQPAPGIRIHDEGRVTSQGFQSLRREIITTTEAVPGTQIERRTVKERPGTGILWDNAPVVSDVETTREKQIKGWNKIKEVIDPDGEALTSTWVYYPPGESTGPGASAKGLGRLKHYVRYDGYEEFYTYELFKTTVKSPYAGDPDGKTTITQWKSGSAASIKTTSTFVNGVMLSTTTTTHSTNSQVQTITTSQGQTLTTATTYKPSGQDFGGKPTRIIHPDGTLTTYDYERLPSGGYITTMDNGSGANGVVTQGIRTITTVTSRGTTILQQTQAIGYAGTQDKDFGTVAVTDLDFIGRALTTAHHPASITIEGETIFAPDPAWTTSVTYSCCGIATETDRTGIVTQHTYDPLKRRVKTTRLGVTTETVHQGLTTETHRYPAGESASSATLVSRSVRNLAGTLQESWSPDPSSTTPGVLVKSSSTATTYKPAADLSSRTITTVPGGHTQTTDSFLDGRTATTSGALSPAMVYHYSVTPTGELTTQAYLDGTDQREITGTQTDLAGRTVKSGRLATLQSTTFMSSASMHYNSKGQLVRTIDPDGVVTHHLYNAKGERTTTATDLQPNTSYNNENDNIEYGTDTVQFSETVPAVDSNSNPVWRSISKVWFTDPQDGIVERIVSQAERSVDGLQSRSWQIGQGPTPTDPNDTFTQTGAKFSTSVTALQGSGNWTTTQTNPDNTFGIATYVDGRMVSSAMFAAGADPEVDAPILATSQAYDDWNRPVETTDSRTGTTVTAYMSATNDAVKSVTDPGNRKTEFVYDTRGRQIKTILPDDSETLTDYNTRGEVTGRSGSQTYPVTYTYDYAGRQKTMTTYGTEEATTTWLYDPATGFLVEKNYDGETDNGDEFDADYTYTAAGRLLTRTWQRGVTTTYGYDSGGRLVSTTYSDNTPDVSITYDALGRQLTQSNGVAKSIFAYNAGNLQINTETIQYDLDPATPGYEFTRILDRSQDTLGRDSGWELKNGTTIENSVATTYGSADGRLATVAGASGSGIFQYGYEPNSNLVATITGPSHTVTNTWEPTRNVLELKENKVGALTISSFNYGVVDNTGGVNEIGQRTSVRTSGTAFSGASSWSWAYDPLGQITLAEHGTNTNFNRAYEYDNIGNRQRAAAGTLNVNDASATLYTANALNQYSSIGNLQSTIVNPIHDADGNMTSGPLPAAPSSASSLAWDAENRLISATVGTTTVTYTYDAQSRRIATQVGSTTTLVAYDGWNPIAEWSADLQSATLTKTYTWGMDLSGSMQGAGGVGGLLAVTKHQAQSTTHYYPTFDGNGNVSEYLDNTGAIVAHYEYDPFGRILVHSGTQFAEFAHRFSTKPQDLTTGLLYYGYRYYDPLTGRWPSRDPIGERGGVNLYGLVGNDGVNKWDYLGLDNGDWIGLFTEAAHFNLWECITPGCRTWLRGNPRDGDPVMFIRSNQLSAVIYRGNNGPNTAESGSCIEIEFAFTHYRGNNSGFHFSIPNDDSDINHVVNEGLEIQLRDRRADDALTNTVTQMDQRSGGLNQEQNHKRNRQSSNRSGAIYMYAEPHTAPELIPNDWNTVRLRLNHLGEGRGMEITVFLNDQEVTRYSQANDPTSVGDRGVNDPRVALRAHGNIALQAHGQGENTAFKKIRWRNVD